MRVGFRRVFRLSETNSVDPHRPSNVFEALVTQILERKVKLTRSVFLNTGRNADPARISQTFEPSRHVHAVTKDVAVLNNDIADIDAYSKFDPASRRHIGVKRGHAALPFGRTPQGIDDTCELDHPSKNRAGR